MAYARSASNYPRERDGMKIYAFKQEGDIPCFSPLCDGKAIIQINWKDSDYRCFCKECCRKIVAKIGQALEETYK